MTVDIAERCAVKGELNAHSTFITMTTFLEKTPVLLVPALLSSALYAPVLLKADLQLT